MRRFFVKSSVGWIVLLVAALLPLSNTAYANHVDSVTLTPPLAITEVDVCSPLVVTTQGTEPVDAVVDIEVTGDGPVRFCLPDAGLNPVLIDPATGDLGLGPLEMDGTIGGEGTTGAGTVLGEGEFTFGIRAVEAGSLDIIAFVEEPPGNDDPDGAEPQATATSFAIVGGGDGDGTEVPGATELVTALDCLPEQDVNASGTRHDFLCRATGAGEAPIPGAEIRFDVINGPNHEEVGNSLCGYSDTNGVATCGYADAEGSASPPGTDTIAGFTGPDLESTANQDSIETIFAGNDSGNATKVGSTVKLRRALKGNVRSTVKQCKKGRKVVVKKVRKGKDRVHGKDRTNRRGVFKVRPRKSKGRFYAVAKKKKFTSGGTPIVCKKAKSRRIRRR